MSIMNHSNYRDFLNCRQNRRKCKHTVLLFRKTMISGFEITVKTTEVGFSVTSANLDHTPLCHIPE